mgnify:FL=1
MEIDIKMMTEEAYRTLKKNYEEVYKMICDHPSDSSWLKDYLGFEPYEVKKYVIDDFELKIADDYKTVEFDNDIKLYETLNKLPKYILCNIRFWAWITFEKAYKQAIAAVPFKSSAIVKNWWLPGNSRRDLMLGVISRGYFKVDVSIDENSKDKYELTRYIMTNSEAYRNIVFRNIGMIKNVCLGILQVEKDIEENYNYSITVDRAREVMKDASRIGSVMHIDTLSKEEIYDILLGKILKRVDVEAVSND